MTRRRRIGMGLVGPGFIAAQHIEPVRRLGYVDVVAVTGCTLASAERKAEEYGVAKSAGPEARRYAHLPGGHQEGWASAFTNAIADIYEWVREGGKPGAQRPTICTFAQAARTINLVDCMLESHVRGGVWIDITPSEPAEVSA